MNYLDTNIEILNNFLVSVKKIYKNFIPKIDKDSKFYAVIIEPREHKNLEAVIKSTMYHLNNSKHTWGLQILHGNKNHEFVKNIINDWEGVELYNIGKDDLTPEQHSAYMETNDFWGNILGEKVLMFQTDSLLINDGIDEFLKYDYVGAPWIIPKEGRFVGNGGLSLRDKKLMIDICDKHKPTEHIWEDIFFAKYMNYENIPPVDVAKKFSVESIFYDNPIGIHKPIKYIDPQDLKSILYRNI